jgi:hypothetical protein
MLLGFVVLASLVAVVPALATVSHPDQETGAKYGVHQDLTYDGYSWRRAKGIDAAASVHAQISRNSLLWSKIESTPGTYDWSIPDSVVDGLIAKGIEPLFVIVGSPSWANGSAPDMPGSQYYVPTDDKAFSTWVRAYSAFVRNAVARYKGRVTKWEIWNEENEHFTWKPQPITSQYAQFFTAIRSAILSVDPKAQVAVGGLNGLCCGVDIPGASFLRALIAQNVKFDSVAIHPYSTLGHAPDVHWQWHANFDDIGMIHDLLVAAKRNVPLWVTEWGWSSGQIGTTLEADYLGRSLNMLRTQYPYVTVATYFLDVDHGTQYQQGLFDPNYRPKPAAAVFANFVESLASTASSRK